MFLSQSALYRLNIMTKKKLYKMDVMQKMLFIQKFQKGKRTFLFIDWVFDQYIIIILVPTRCFGELLLFLINTIYTCGNISIHDCLFKYIQYQELKLIQHSIQKHLPNLLTVRWGHFFVRPGRTIKKKKKVKMSKDLT